MAPSITMINEREGKITVWKELVEKFFCKFYPESYDIEEEMLDEGDNWGIDPLEFISRVNSSFENNMKVDGRTKEGNNTTTDSFFKPCLKMHEMNNVEEEDERSQAKRKCDNTSNYIDEQPTEIVCANQKV
ncbi:hypothetical protein Tco_0930211 [Tanacetum coccineum]